MALSNQEKSQLRAFIQSNQWATVQKIANDLCDKIQNENVAYENEWNLVQSTLKKEGQIHGIRRFIQELFVNIE